MFDHLYNSDILDVVAYGVDELNGPRGDFYRQHRTIQQEQFAELLMSDAGAEVIWS